MDRDEEVALLGRTDSSKLKSRVKLAATGCALGIFAVLATVWFLDLGGFFQFDAARWVEITEDPIVSPVDRRAPVNFLALGDWGRHGLYNQSLVASQMGKIGGALEINFVVSVGDNFYKNGLTGVDDIAFDESFSRIYTAPALQKPWHAVLGNHDYHGDVFSQLDPRLGLRDWRWHCVRDAQLIFDLSPSLFRGDVDSRVSTVELFFVDTVPFIDQYWAPNQKHDFDWRDILPRHRHLQQKLENLTSALNASTASWKIVVGHHTIRSYGAHGDSVELVRQLLPILEGNNVDVYVNGHDHCLEHVKRDDSPIHFITSGGGSKAWKGISPPQNSNGLQFYYDGQGFVSFSVAESWLQIVYYNIYGEAVHKVRLTK
ncbi:hypothetical protein SELMODRAFT_228150 [Selaginella moellendorffii]|uniref:Purple acid phosphatase n=1 Tax=Selaginella moellendorffii TaxID=88036 RepID=D8RNV5_SELML|nr:purple acid phosphatase 4 [Selaginella moellendorffii]EFJ25933.1 hypothetical protein SELMODRAFT_228150 [Selaginella moellendorffii]|eukprot:XP_024533415.1 purple acid phosphatase 4 [Selaginella moellendorffii]